MLVSQYFILSIENKRYDSLRSNRKLKISSKEDLPYEQGSILLIYIRDDNKIVAEYDIEDFDLQGRKVELKLEPIYNAPTGLEMTDLVLLTLTTYSLDEWKERLQTDIFSITKRDFEEVVSRLK